MHNFLFAFRLTFFGLSSRGAAFFHQAGIMLRSARRVNHFGKESSYLSGLYASLLTVYLNACEKFRTSTMDTDGNRGIGIEG